MTEIRQAIDQIDRQVVSLLGHRFKYVLAASKFKTTEAGVRDAERFRSVLQQRREWAAAEGLDPDAIEKLYRDLVTHFIEEEMKRWRGDRRGGAE